MSTVPQAQPPPPQEPPQGNRKRPREKIGPQVYKAFKKGFLKSEKNYHFTGEVYDFDEVQQCEVPGCRGRFLHGHRIYAGDNDESMMVGSVCARGIILHESGMFNLTPQVARAYEKTQPPGALAEIKSHRLKAPGCKCAVCVGDIERKINFAREIMVKTQERAEEREMQRVVKNEHVKEWERAYAALCKPDEVEQPTTRSDEQPVQPSPLTVCESCMQLSWSNMGNGYERIFHPYISKHDKIASYAPNKFPCLKVFLFRKPNGFWAFKYGACNPDGLVYGYARWGQSTRGLSRCILQLRRSVPVLRDPFYDTYFSCHE